jgi:hypothetical protein
MDLQRVHRVAGRVIPPKVLDERVDRHDVTRSQREDR